jgi:hypothetical protein
MGSVAEPCRRCTPAWSRAGLPADKRGVGHDAEDPLQPPAGSPPRLHPLRGGAGAGPPARVRLTREFKGLTSLELPAAHAGRRLPGQVRSVADTAPGAAGLPVLAGPGHERRLRRRRRALLLAAAGVLALLAVLWIALQALVGA